MSIDELTEKTTIDFPRPIGRKYAEDLLFYLSSHLHANVSGSIDYDINYLYDSEEESSLEDEGAFGLTIRINRMKGVHVFDTFVSEPYEKDVSLISKIASQRVPGWRLSNYRPEVRELWDDVRKVINEYFMEKFGESVYSKEEES